MGVEIIQEFANNVRRRGNGLIEILEATEKHKTLVETLTALVHTAFILEGQAEATNQAMGQEPESRHHKIIERRIGREIVSEDEKTYCAPGYPNVRWDNKRKPKGSL